MAFTRKQALAINRGRRRAGLPPNKFRVLSKAATARRKKATTKRRPAKRAATKRTATKRRAPARAKAPAKRRRRAKKATLFQTGLNMLQDVAPIAIGVIGAGMLASVKKADTPLKKTLVVGVAGAGLAMFAPKIARQVPLVNRAVVRGIGTGLVLDAAFRGSSTLRAKAPGLPAAARRSGGILAGRSRSRKQFQREMARVTGSTA